MAEFAYQDLLPLGEDVTAYRLLTREGVSTLDAGGRRFLEVAPAALTELSRAAMRDIAHLFRTGHLQQLADILRVVRPAPARASAREDRQDHERRVEDEEITRILHSPEQRRRHFIPHS